MPPRRLHVRVVHPAGEIDLATAPEAFDSSQIVQPHERVVVDLSRVTFIDAAGLGALVSLRNTVHRGGGDLHVTGAGVRQARTFDIGGLSTLLHVPRGADSPVASPPNVAAIAAKWAEPTR